MKTVLRTIKSRRAIKQAFLQLMNEKGYNNVTITDIADRALINRKTFYMHYDTKQALYDEICNELIELLDPESTMKTLHELEGHEQRKPVIRLLMNIRREKDVFSVLINDENNMTFLRKLCDKIAPVILMETHSHKDIILMDEELLIEVYCTLFVLMLKWWIKNDHTEPDMAIDLILEFFSRKPLELLGISF